MCFLVFLHFDQNNFLCVWGLPYEIGWITFIRFLAVTHQLPYPIRTYSRQLVNQCPNHNHTHTLKRERKTRTCTKIYYSLIMYRAEQCLFEEEDDCKQLAKKKSKVVSDPPVVPNYLASWTFSLCTYCNTHRSSYIEAVDSRQ